MYKIMKDLKYALSRKRPHGGVGVNELGLYIIESIEESTKRNDLYFVDFCGNIHVDLRINKNNKTLFTAHVDTVHKEDGVNKYTTKGHFIHADRDVLGADDGAGVAILLHLIRNDVPAYYIFFQGEEKGGIGSSWLAKCDPNLLMEFNRAIAFDRKETYSIISHQGYTRCASDEFCEKLAAELNTAEGEFMYCPDNTGLYTDTAEFTYLIPECTNISVGYSNEHTIKESLDINHFYLLSKAVLKIDWDSLPTVRNPNVIESFETNYSYKKPETKGFYNYLKEPVLDQHYYGSTYGVEEDYYHSYYKDEQQLVGSEEDRLYDLFMDFLEIGLKDPIIEELTTILAPGDIDLAKNYIKEEKIDASLIQEALYLLDQKESYYFVLDWLLQKVYKGS